MKPAIKKRQEKLLTYRQWNKIAEEKDSRSDYKNRIEEILDGGIQEFYKARFAEKNGCPDLVKHWDKEAYYHIVQKLFGAIGHTTTFKNRSLAILGVITEFKKRDARYRAQAETIVFVDFPYLKKIKTIPLSNDDMSAFWKIVNETIERALA